MLALAAEPRRAVGGHVSDDEVARTYEAYGTGSRPSGRCWTASRDIAEDRASGEHSYVAHYPSMEVAVERIGELVRRSRSEARALSAGARHAVIAQLA